MPTPALPDLVLLVLIFVGYPVWDYFIAWPRARGRLASGDPDARRAIYRGAMLTQWSATAVVVALWMVYRRDASLLWLQPPVGTRLIIAAVLAALVIALMAAQAICATRADDATRAELRPRLGYAIPILPRTTLERSWFMVLSLTAGTCE